MATRAPTCHGWRNRGVRLVVLGAAGTAVAATLGGCGRTGYQRNVYKDDLDCAVDYSLDICERQGKSEKGKFLGPLYRTVAGVAKSCHSKDPGPGRSSAETSKSVARGVVEVERGGFGTQALEPCDWGGGTHVASSRSHASSGTHVAYVRGIGG